LKQIYAVKQYHVYIAVFALAEINYIDDETAEPKPHWMPPIHLLIYLSLANIESIAHEQ
jgi:hypothetical protein